jgi:hypothetical protein
MSKAARTRQAVLDLLREHQAGDALPTSGRFVFYELEQRGLATKPDPADPRPNKRRSRGWPPGEQDVTDALTWLREHGEIPWSWLVDETRRLSHWDHGASVAEHAGRLLDQTRINPWRREPPLVLCESRATAGVLERVTGEYVCPVAGTSGQSAGFLRTVVAPLLAGSRAVIYLGDLDRSGLDIEANTRRVLGQATGRELDWTRLAMTQQQADDIEPIWKVDGRDRVGHWAWEVESLGQAGLVALVRDTVDSLLPEPLADVLEREAAQRTRLAEYLAEWSA